MHLRLLSGVLINKDVCQKGPCLNIFVVGSLFSALVLASLSLSFSNIPRLTTFRQSPGRLRHANPIYVVGTTGDARAPESDLEWSQGLLQVEERLTIQSTGLALASSEERDLGKSGGADAVGQGRGQNQCDACPIFITMAVQGRDNRTLRVSKKYRDWSFRNSTIVFSKVLLMLTHSIGMAHPGCFQLILYTDDEELVRRSEQFGFGDSLRAEYISTLPLNVFDFDSFGNASLPKPLDVRTSPIKELPAKGRSWYAISRSKLDLAKRHLNKGEKVIWVDLDTLIISDMSCIYKRETNFVTAPGLGMNKFSHLALSEAPLYVPHVTHQDQKDFWTRAHAYPEYNSLPKDSFVFGDLWMLDEELLKAVLGVEQELFERGFVSRFDLQTYFTILHSRGYAHMRDLVQAYPDYCWGFQWVVGEIIPNKPSAPLFKTAAINGSLLCLNGCKKVGAMSFTWMSFADMLRHPCYFFNDPSAWKWFMTHLYQYKHSVLPWMSEGAESQCKQDMARDVTYASWGYVPLSPSNCSVHM